MYVLLWFTVLFPHIGHLHRQVAALALQRARERLGALFVDLRVLLDDEVGDRDVQVDGRGGQDRAEEVVRDDRGVERLGDRRDLLAVRQPAGQPDRTSSPSPHPPRPPGGEDL